MLQCLQYLAYYHKDFADNLEYNDDFFHYNILIQCTVESGAQAGQPAAPCGGGFCQGCLGEAPASHLATRGIVAG